MKSRVRMERVRRASRAFGVVAFALFLTSASTAPAVDTPHSDYQTVDESGFSVWTGTYPCSFTGIVLNNPEDMLNTTPITSYAYDPWNLGGQWQVFVQAADPTRSSDWGGTALWLGQMYSNLGFIHAQGKYTDYYSADAWGTRLGQLNYGGQDPATTQPLRAGDLIQVYARAGLEHVGKNNVNETHDINPAYHFDISMVQRGAGLPTPVDIHLADVLAKNPDGTFSEIFCATRPSGAAAPLSYNDPRLAGGEKYQSQRITLRNVHVTQGTANAWGPGATVTLTDASGREFPLVIGQNNSFQGMSPPTGNFDVTGIFDQEGTEPNGYQMWVMNVADIKTLLRGDLSGDGTVNIDDFTILQQNWGQDVIACDLSQGDASGDGMVGIDDFTILQQNWGAGTSQAMAAPTLDMLTVPEPSTLVTLLVGLGAIGGALLLRWRRGIASVALMLLLAGSASADTMLSFNPVSPRLAGYHTQDMVLSTPTGWYNSELLVTLSQGGVYQDPSGGNTPLDQFFGLVPSLQYDTFVTGGHIDHTLGVLIPGGAVDLGGNSAATFDQNTSGIDVTWGGQSPITTAGDLTLARVTLSNTASGTWKAMVTVPDATHTGFLKLSYGGTIAGGVMNVPEPATWSTLAVGGLVCLAWACRRRAAR